jgi:hypothetical protein
LQREGGDDAGGEGSAAKGVEALLDFRKVSNAVAVCVRCRAAGTDYTLDAVWKAVSVLIRIAAGIYHRNAPANDLTRRTGI